MTDAVNLSPVRCAGCGCDYDRGYIETVNGVTQCRYCHEADGVAAPAMPYPTPARERQETA
jgi:cytochrome c553